MRDLALVLGDQLTHANPALDGQPAPRRAVLMIEAAGESTVVWSHQARTALFLSAMRHFAAELRGRGHTVDYVALDDPGPDDFGARLRRVLRARRPDRLVVCEPGEYRMLALVQDACRAEGVALEVRADTHFIADRETFARWAGTGRTLRREFFYRRMRRATGVLMADGAPAGGRWNFDAENRAGFGKAGPGPIPAPPAHAPDAVTRAVLKAVRARFAGHPGRLEGFAWPVTRAQALASLAAFVRERLPAFGRYQDAMWADTPYAWHSALSAALNLKLLDPREVIGAAVGAWRGGHAPLPAVEGFVRQVLGWREFVRGVYWLDMPGLRQTNHFGHARPLPRWHWSGDTQMNCMRQAIGQTLRLGYAHHIQRLMVTGNFALLAGLAPREVCDWYLAVYVDAVEWAELPNTAGMALYANGGRFTSKPYAASGAYINRMSNYCAGCRYDPRQRSGPRACPFTVLYWGFLERHQAPFARNPRTRLMARSLDRLSRAERAALRRAADHTLETIDRL
jgi:deoxyribodipyrimidine photolyase-related protein